MASDWDTLLNNQNSINKKQTALDRTQADLMKTQHEINSHQLEIAKTYNHDFSGLQQLLSNRQDIADEAYKLSDTASHMDEIIEKNSASFSELTGLTKNDLILLITATALQVIRQYVFTGNANWNHDSRPNDQDAAGSHKYDRDQRGRQYYHTTLAEIATNPVPFDTQNNSGSFKVTGLFGAVTNVNLGGGKGHRSNTLGHDPLLGWVFGTANIATRTVTLSSFDSFHVQYGTFNGGTRMNDYFSNHADTIKVLNYGLLNNFKQLKNGILVASLLKEGQHLKSDVFSKESLGLPLISSIPDIGPKVVQEFNEYGLDTCNVLHVGYQVSFSLLINYIIAVIHRLMYDPEKDGTKDLYKVRTRKIISYSNVIASSSNILFVGLSSALSGGNTLKQLDIGGLIVTIGSVLRNGKVQEDIYQEFMKNKLYETISNI